VTVVVAVGIAVPYVSWFHTNWESDSARWTARLATLVLIAAWFVGRPVAVLISDQARKHVIPCGPSDKGISVIVPCHNASRKIEALVETVLQQDYRPLELILVENNSTDETWGELLRLERKHPEVHVCWIPPKPGEYAASVALNVAVERAAYPVILRIDDDTVLAPGAIRAAMIAITPDMHTGVACNLRVSNPNETLWTRLQTVEYMLAMELDRRSQALLQTVLICAVVCKCSDETSSSSTTATLRHLVSSAKTLT
jgi:cellulose synthase/poly-beta-1,6-N-acetylglucosamine synthase-like glycosyltransferase